MKVVLVLVCVGVLLFRCVIGVLWLCVVSDASDASGVIGWLLHWLDIELCWMPRMRRESLVGYCIGW